MNHKALLVLVSTTFCSALFAAQQPIGYPSDARIKMVAYQPHNVVELQANTFTSTQLIFAQDETVINIDGGDTAVWSITTKKVTPNVISLKPTQFGSNSNLTVFTNKHIYYFHILSNSDLKSSTQNPTYALQFIYPEQERAKALARLKEAQAHKNVPLKPERYYLDYTFSGNSQLRPLHVFDNGVFTYFEFDPQKPIPALFAVDGQSGKESAINYFPQGKYIVVTRIAPQFTLRHGNEFVASVFNTREIARIKRGG